MTTAASATSTAGSNKRRLMPSWWSRTEEWTPQAKSILNMALASAIHFAGYEYARAATLTLMTSERAGFSSSSIVPFAMGCVSPFSLLTLWLYDKMLNASGPSTALQNCTLLYALVLGLGGITLQFIDPFLVLVEEGQGQQPIPTTIYHDISKHFLFLLFIVENCFVQLLFSQHWAFMSSVQTKEQAAVWFAPIAGIGSIASTAAAMTVAPFMNRVGLTGLLVISALFMLISGYFARSAYRIAQEHGFEPAPKDLDKKKDTQHQSKDDKKNFFQRAIALFARVPILGALCLEVVVCQCQTSLLNSLFVLKMKDVFPNDDERARYTGNCYACINAFSGVLQFVVLPVMAKLLNSQQLWLVMPSVMVVCAGLMCVQKEASIYLVSASFLLIKGMEYSVRGVTTEMVYVSLDYESRFLGKEIIGVFVNRVGKSAMAIGLSAVTAYFGSQFDLYYLSVALAFVATAWLLVCFRLTNILARIKSNEDEKAKTE